METILDILSKEPAKPKMDYPSMQGQGLESVELPAEPNKIYPQMSSGTVEMSVKNSPGLIHKSIAESFNSGASAFVQSVNHWCGAAKGAEMFDANTQAYFDKLADEAAANRYDEAALKVVFKKVSALFGSLKMEKRR